MDIEKAKSCFFLGLKLRTVGGNEIFNLLEQHYEPTIIYDNII